MSVMGSFALAVARTEGRGLPFPLALLVLGGLLCVPGCGTAPSEPPETRSNAPSDAESEPKRPSLFDGLGESEAEAQAAQAGQLTRPIVFADVHETAGIPFIYDNGASSKKLMPEATSGGGGWLDYDRDGWPDLYFPQGGQPDAKSWKDQPVDQLYRNLGDGTFQNVTAFSMILDQAYGHGVVAGDYDNDGFEDLYVSNVGGADALYHNLGDGTFDKIPSSAMPPNLLWASSAAWGDLDLDGDLDLYVCNYVDYDPHHPISCFDKNQKPYTCHPNDVDPVPNRCYINQGDGTFTEESDARGLNGPGSKSLGVVIADFDGDGLPDVYVANDTEANHLFMNQGKGRFEERALLLGCSLSGLGQKQASMGLAFGDYDRNGFPDLYSTHFTSDSNTLYQNLGPTGFTDATHETGLHQPTLLFLGFGTVMQDFNLDGWQELFVANGHIDDWRELNGDAWKMKPQLFTYGGSKWRELTDEAGDYFQQKFLGRAVATADYDRDGDLDLAVVHQNDPVGLLRNDSETGHWQQLRFIGDETNRRGIGVKVRVRQGDLALVQQLPGGTSYCASHEPILVFGLGDSAAPCDIRITWPSGKTQHLENVPVDQFLTLRERDAKAK